MKKQLEIKQGINPVSVQPSCMDVAFFTQKNSPLFLECVRDDRGMRYELQCQNTVFAEIIHSKPNSIRGNHVHVHTMETFIVLSGEAAIYLLCRCRGRHLFKANLKPGTGVTITPGIAHALHILTDNESVAVFDHDPRNDRSKVSIITSPNSDGP